MHLLNVSNNSNEEQKHSHTPYTSSLTSESLGASWIGLRSNLIGPSSLSEAKVNKQNQ